MKVGEIWQLKDKEKKFKKRVLAKMRKSWKLRDKEPMLKFEEWYDDERTDSLVRIIDICKEKQVVYFLHLNDIPNAEWEESIDEFIKKYEKVYR